MNNNFMIDDYVRTRFAGMDNVRFEGRFHSSPTSPPLQPSPPIIGPDQEGCGCCDLCDYNPAVMELKRAMRRLWMQHVIWTRSFVVSDVANLADKKAVLDRLLTNQDDIGVAIKPYYGNEAGDTLAKLLREHILIAAQVLDAAKNNNQVALQHNNRLWYENADQIAHFLTNMNSCWDYETLNQLLYKHLEILTEQVVARIKGDWVADIMAYDKGEDHILMLADALSLGIMEQFPEKFN